MAARKKARKSRSKPLSIPPAPAEILLDQFSVQNIKQWKAHHDKVLQYHWDYYQHLAYQRSKVGDQIRASLLEAAIGGYGFTNWQRLVEYKYSLQPLSVAGSLTDPGGRFNIGNINPLQFPRFPALYIAFDKETGLQEALSQEVKPDREEDALFFALTNHQSVASISISGQLESVIDLGQPDRLVEFINCFSNFDIPETFAKTAKQLGLPPPGVIHSVDKMLADVLAPNWRDWPMLFDVPHTSQIFGQLVEEADIDGILFASKFNGKKCLAIYPQNFHRGLDSYIDLDDEPPAETEIRRLDHSTWGMSLLG